ncbi:hypothetical protein EDC04DRAFT_2600861 [Pisolithus marmoratus]|nr:hypothetical protein EDC04DRAFT_2600861 [Pisolithus marmoratus]
MIACNVSLTVDGAFLGQRDTASNNQPNGQLSIHIAGMGTLLVSKIREEHPDRVICTHSIPPPKSSCAGHVVEPNSDLRELAINIAEVGREYEKEGKYEETNSGPPDVTLASSRRAKKRQRAIVVK